MNSKRLDPTDTQNSNPLDYYSNLDHGNEEIIEPGENYVNESNEIKETEVEKSNDQNENADKAIEKKDELASPPKTGKIDNIIRFDSPGEEFDSNENLSKPTIIHEDNDSNQKEEKSITEEGGNLADQEEEEEESKKGRDDNEIIKPEKEKEIDIPNEDPSLANNKEINEKTPEKEEEKDDKDEESAESSEIPR